MIYKCKMCGGELDIAGKEHICECPFCGVTQTIPNVDEESRIRARELVAHDINAARKMLPADFRYTDAQRVARALEVFFQTGHHITEYQKNARVGAVLPNETVKILINPDAKILRERIAGRIPEMLSGGAIDEARAIIQNNWNPSRAIGAVQLVDFLNGKTDRDTAIQNWITKTNQYAKRQRTWFRTQFSPDIVFDHVPTDADTELVLQY